MAVWKVRGRTNNRYIFHHFVTAPYAGKVFLRNGYCLTTAFVRTPEEQLQSELPVPARNQRAPHLHDQQHNWACMHHQVKDIHWFYQFAGQQHCHLFYKMRHRSKRGKPQCQRPYYEQKIGDLIKPFHGVACHFLYRKPILSRKSLRDCFSLHIDFPSESPLRAGNYQAGGDEKIKVSRLKITI